MTNNKFPSFQSIDFTERDCILHSLIEDTVERRSDEEYVLNMIDYLAKYREKWR